MSVAQTNHYLNEMMFDEVFWKQKCLQDFGPIAHIKPYDVLQKAYYCTLWKRNYPQPIDAESASDAGRIAELQWLLQRQIHPSFKGANATARNGDLDTLEWLGKINVFPDVIGANWAAIRNHLKVVRWMSQHNIYPDTYGLKTAIKNECRETVEWLRALVH
jgi:hypothetical protein